MTTIRFARVREDTPVRVQSPFGEHYVLDVEAAPTISEGAALYARMIDVRELDRCWRSIINGRKRSIPPQD